MPEQTHAMTHQFACYATTLGVRDLVIKLRDTLISRSVDESVRMSVEIAVAEALNNVVEHALKETPRAEITVDLSIDAARVFVVLEDPGDALPAWTLNKEEPVDLTVPLAQMPEGGFGWLMINDLSDRLDYSRRNDTNHLRMWFELPRLAG